MQIISKIDNDYTSFNRLIDFYYENEKINFSDIDIEFKLWISANICSMIGALFDKIRDRGINNFKIYIQEYSLKNILERNNFLSFWGYNKIPDYYNSTIQYLKFSIKENQAFSKYITNELFQKEDLPQMTVLLKKKLTETIYEIFVNAKIHSQTDYIYTCGQFFPKKKEMYFMITDLGIGIKEKVNHELNKSFSSVEAIEWAMQEGNTTKKRDSGGLGLSLLKEFIQKNNGKIQVISDNGYWEFSSNGVYNNYFKRPFPGTVINIMINTDDQDSYALSGEINDNEIF